MAVHLFSLSRFFAFFAVFILIGAPTDAVCEYLTLVPPPYAPSSNLTTKPLIVDAALYWHVQPLNSDGHPIPGLLVNQPCTILIKIKNIGGTQEKLMEQLHYQGMHPELYTVMEDSMAEPFGPVSWDGNRLAWVSSIRTNPSPGWISFYISSSSRISTLSQAVKSTLVTVAASSLLENYQSLLPFMPISLKAQAKRPLTSSFVPMLTPISFIVLDEPNTFIISYDQHQSSQIVTLQKGWQIDGSDSVRIRNMIFFSQHIIMQTEEAIYSGVLDQGKMNWREQLRIKISAIRSSSILLPYSTTSWSEATFAFSSFPPRIFGNFGPSDNTFHELKSADQMSIDEFLNGNYEIVDVAYTASSPTNVPILVKNKDSNLYSYVRYHLVDDSQNVLAFSSGKWELLYRLPARIPIVTGSKHGSAVPLYQTGFSETKQLELSNFSILSTLSQYVYLWGNALIFSPDHGNTFYTIHSTRDLRITQFSSNNRGAFVFISNNQEIWYGQVGSIVSRILPWTVEAPLLPFFDSVGDLKFYLLLTSDSPTLQEDLLLVTFLSEFLIDEQSEGEEVSCPIKEINFSADFSTALTRAPAVPTGLKDLEKSYIPSTLFFDLNYRYEFDIFLTPNKNLLPTDVGISFQLEQSTPYISLASSRREISGGRLQYHVYLQESGEYDGMYEPGTNLAPSSLIILVDNATFSCQNERAPTQLKSSTYYEIPLFTGCPPSQRLEYSHQKSIERDQGCDSWDGIPCLYFDFTFAPVFELIDEVTGAITDYSVDVTSQGYYIFEIVGAGGDLDSIEMFDEDELVLYNNGTSRIWSPLQPALDDQRVLITKEGRNEIIWACSPGSPCYDVLPRFPNTPYYYFVIQISTKGMNNGNYCDYRKRMTLRVHGIPMTMEWTVGLTFSSVGFFIFLFVMRFLIKSRIPESRVSRVPR